MSSPNKNSAEMNAWLAEANANQFVRSNEFGNPNPTTQLESPNGTDPTDAAVQSNEATTDY